MKQISNKKNLIIGITGDSGFLGQNLVSALKKLKYKVLKFSHDYWEITEDLSFPKTDTLFHLAACSSIYECSENPKKCYDINVIGTQNVVNAAKRNGVKRIIFSSSTILYQKENTPYKTSKQEAEKIVMDSGIPYTILRISAISGEGVQRGPWYDTMNHRIYLHPLSIINFVPIEKVVSELIKSINNKGNIIRDVKGEDITLLNLFTYFGYPVVKR